MLAHEEVPDQPGALAALHITQEVRHALTDTLVLLRIKEDRVCLRSVRLGRVKEPIPSEANAHALQIVLRKNKRLWVPDMRPTSLWLIAAYEDRILVLASGTDAWEFKRVELAQALEKMKDVLMEV